jgi:GTP cyclohydrolase FolE2
MEGVDRSSLSGDVYEKPRERKLGIHMSRWIEPLGYE